MADNYLELKMLDYRARLAPKHRAATPAKPSTAAGKHLLVDWTSDSICAEAVISALCSCGAIVTIAHGNAREGNLMAQRTSALYVSQSQLHRLPELRHRSVDARLSIGADSIDVAKNGGVSTVTFPASTSAGALASAVLFLVADSVVPGVRITF